MLYFLYQKTKGDFIIGFLGHPQPQIVWIEPYTDLYDYDGNKIQQEEWKAWIGNRFENMRTFGCCTT